MKNVYDPQTESQEYLRRVLEKGIGTRSISVDEAIKASTLQNGNFAQRLIKALPFDGCI